MNKMKRSFFALLLSIFFIPSYLSADTNYTIDDLRVLMGMHRLSEDGSMLEIKRLLSTCYKQSEWNELVSALGDIEDSELKDFKEKEDAWYNAKDILDANFISNQPIETILSDYANYQTAASLRVEYTTANSVKLSLIDTDDIEEKIAYANSVLETSNDDTDIGVIGSKMQTFTQAKLLISIPYGSSYSIDSGRKQSNNGLTISIPQDYEICSQFNGIVSELTNNSVTIKTGKAIEIEYLGVQPIVNKKQKIKQYATIGKTNSKTMIIKIKLNTVYVDPLFLYGSRSIDWYEQWKNENPGCVFEEKDYSNLLDNLSQVTLETASEQNSAGTMESEDGNANQIEIQGDNKYKDTPDHLVIEKTESGIIENGK